MGVASGTPKASIHEILLLAADLRVSFEVDVEKLQIIARPDTSVTDELRDMIQDNRVGLLRRLIYRRAVLWLEEQARSEEEKDRMVHGLEEYFQEIERAWGASPREFRDILRRIVGEVVRNVRKVV